MGSGERYPSDEDLLALTEDAATGVEYIPTGKTPYYLAFRKMLQRLNLAAGLANGLRIYQDGDLSIGVRAGRVRVGSVFAGKAVGAVSGVSVTDSATTNVYVDATGAIKATTSAFPTDRSTHVRLGTVTAAGGLITGISDLRGEAAVMSVLRADAQAVALVHQGNLTASATGQLCGSVPVDGAVVDVVLSIGTNMVSSNGADGITITAKVNGAAVCTTDPVLTSSDGSGFRSTAQGDGAAGVVKSDGTQVVQAGDIVTVDVTRTAAGVVSTQAADVVASVLVRAKRED